MPERAPSAPAPHGRTNGARAGRRVQMRRSPVHGKGVFALRDIAAGEVLLEYTGERISWQQALVRHPHDPLQPQHTFYFHIDDGRVIDAKFGGNCSRWINHSCAPNCQADEHAGRIFITALQPIRAGEELSFDYGLVLEARHSAAVKAEYRCRCGAANCRGTLLAPKRGRTAAALPAAPARSAARTAKRAGSAARKAGDQAGGKAMRNAAGAAPAGTAAHPRSRNASGQTGAQLARAAGAAQQAGARSATRGAAGAAVPPGRGR